MKLTSYLRDGQARVAVIDGAAAYDLNDADERVPADLAAALRAGVDLHAAAAKAREHGARLEVGQLRQAPTVPSPGKIFCLGLNYFDHAAESGRNKPDYPWFFMRATSSLMAHGDPVLLPKVSTHLDYEAEMAVVISKRGKHITADRAFEHVFGYTCFNDFSIRDYQKRTGQWTIGKNFDATGAFGPMLVTADELSPGAVGLKIEGRLNGETMQSASTTDMIFGVAETIALLSECMTLEPGDVIVMGTPAGVGQSRKPPVWLKAGDRFEVEIESLGVLSNVVVAEP